MSVTLSLNHTPVEVKSFKFPGGEIQVRVLFDGYDKSEPVNRWTLRVIAKTSDDIIEALLVADAVRSLDPDARITLRIPYLPYARQDRSAYPGEAFSLAVVARLLATGSFHGIMTWDVHSEVASKLIPGLKSIPASTFLKGHLLPGEKVVAPDAGAVARASKCASDANPLVRAVKHRDPDTGELSEPRLQDLVGATDDLIVVDDICDGGRTFLQLGKVLRQKTSGRLRLYVTHGIFSAGTDDLLAVYDEILVANLMNEAVRGTVTALF